MPETPFLDAVADDLHKQIDAAGGDPANLDPVLRPIAYLYTAQAIIDNGGFQYFFEFDFLQAPYSVFVDAYRAIGAPDAAALLQAAIDFFPFPDPHLHPAERAKFMMQASLPDEGYFSPECDAIYDMDIWGKMDLYVQEHPAAFGATIN